MKFKNSLNDILGSGIKIELLRYLITNPGRYTGRELAKRVGYSHPAVMSGLNDLHMARVVTKEKVGNAYIFTFNKKHILAEKIVSLFDGERDALDLVVERFAEELEGKLEGIIVFGSAASGSADEKSDIDMVISFKRGIDPNKYRMKVVDASSETIVATGSSVDYFLLKHSELLEKMQDKNKKGMWKDIFGDQPVILFHPIGDKLGRSFFPKGEWMKPKIFDGRTKETANG